MGGYGQVTFTAQNDRPISGCSAAQREEHVEYGQIKFAKQPKQKNQPGRPDGETQGSEYIEYGEIKFAERPRQKNRRISPDGAPHGVEQVEYGEIKFSERSHMARWMQMLLDFILFLSFWWTELYSLNVNFQIFLHAIVSMPCTYHVKCYEMHFV